MNLWVSLIKIEKNLKKIFSFTKRFFLQHNRKNFFRKEKIMKNFLVRAFLGLSFCLCGVALAEDGVYRYNETYASPSAYTVQSGQDSKGSFGIGYIYGSYTAKQRYQGLTDGDIKGTAHGFDFYTTKDSYIVGGFGISFGVGMEMLFIKWDGKGLYGFEDGDISAYRSVYFNDDMTISPYLNLGLFYDVVKNQSLKVKLFGKIGVAWDLMYGGRYDGWTASWSYYSGYYAEEPAIRIDSSYSFPIDVGARFVFGHHGIEATAKFRINDAEYSNSFYGYKYTTIKHNVGFALRYVYEF